MKPKKLKNPIPIVTTELIDGITISTIERGFEDEVYRWNQIRYN